MVCGASRRRFHANVCRRFAAHCLFDPPNPGAHAPGYESSTPSGFSVRARNTCNIAAAVGHWGHIHQRRNQHVAELTVEPVVGVWKITGLELVQKERL